MDLNNLTNEEEKILATGKLLAYCDDRIIIEPPCHAEIILDLFTSFNHTGNSRNRETPLEKLQNDFPNIVENELLDLISYFKQVKDYCNLVCCAYAQKYPYPVGSKKSNEEQEDVGQVVKACRQRYPWLEQEYIESYLKGVVYMCIR
ncbi:MAG: hypothetical protein E7294_12265 [Lachnospiraceae bacterium]|jgi:hypothetical protein|nr:hypothetical protein [Lachnospiraceae bacterium]